MSLGFLDFHLWSSNCLRVTLTLQRGDDAFDERKPQKHIVISFDNTR